MIALISDIHGNYEALKRVLEVLDDLGITDIYCLGDVVGYYPQVNECCDELRRRDARCVMGNHDWYMVSGTDCPRSRSVNDCLRYQRKIITEDNIAWLASFPVIRAEHGVSMVHGGWRDPIDEYLAYEDGYFKDMKLPYFASGHTHKQTLIKDGAKIYCNPGSVGQPRDGDARAAFALFDGNDFVLQRCDYDIQCVCDLMSDAGFSAYYYGCLRDASANLHE